MTDSSPVGFFDSGIGGLPYLERARETLPNEQFVYFADSARFPYGEIPADAVSERVIEVTGYFISKYKPKVIVVACNTASVVALSGLRSTYEIPFVGVVPAVKPAAEGANGKPIGLLATSRTVRDDYTKRLIESHAANCEVINYTDGSLIEEIEKNAGISTGNDTIEEIIKHLTEQMISDGIERLVLGCTHFVYCAERFMDLLGSGVKVVDSRDGVIRQLTRILTHFNLMAEHNRPGDSILVESGKRERLRKAAEYSNLTYRGTL